MQPVTYTISYRYTNPSSAGPYTGRMPSEQPVKRGETIRAPFGAAVVTSCRKRSA